MEQVHRRRDRRAVLAAAGHETQVETTPTGLARLGLVELLPEEPGQVRSGYEGFRVSGFAGWA